MTLQAGGVPLPLAWSGETVPLRRVGLILARDLDHTEAVASAVRTLVRGPSPVGILMVSAGEGAALDAQICLARFAHPPLEVVDDRVTRQGAAALWDRAEAWAAAAGRHYEFAGGPLNPETGLDDARLEMAIRSCRMIWERAFGVTWEEAIDLPVAERETASRRARRRMVRLLLNSRLTGL